MKTLTTTAIILSLALSGSAFAELGDSLDLNWLKNIKVYDSKISSRRASQPEIGTSSSINEVEFTNDIIWEVEKHIINNDQ